jgi:hypothetical protein
MSVRPRRSRRVWIIAGSLALLAVLTLAANGTASSRINHALDTLSAATDNHVTLKTTGAPALVDLATRRVSLTASIDQTGLNRLVACTASAKSAGATSGSAGLKGVTIALNSTGLSATKTITVAGRSLPASISLDTSVEDGELLLTPGTVSVAGLQLPAAQLERLLPATGKSSAATLLQPRKIGSDLPAGVTLQSVNVSSSRLEVGLSAPIGIDASRGNVGAIANC